MLCSEWGQRVRDPLWHPFKIQRCGDKIKEVVDEEDAKLKNLSEEWGLRRRREERIPVLWNFEHGRKATLKEGIVAHMKHQINNLKRKRT
ncbi:hypothetical protein DY000_02026853 [Brassica cretica]|uniref:Factor of DNA methylation 1-5/IDN2 domain-containing protein n=1 Tax=Brassica cretica TaxID=69181 RepID=A0ABQ7EHC5_BRACR|nr:hypothetical protein DY000_02026853 [Brassica cretica]